jgi:hypothetical protein
MNIVRYSIASSILLALAAAGCAAADESGQSSDGESVAKAAEGADQLPDGFTFAPETVSDDKAANPAELSPKGSVTLTLGSTFYAPVTIPAFGTVTYETSNRVGSTDPVLALFIRTNPWGGAFGGSPFTAKGQANTLGFNDDGAGNLNSRITYTNPDGVPRQAYLIAFAYGNQTGQVDLTGFGTIQIRAGSAIISSNQGWIGTSASTGDPWLVAIDPDIGGGDTTWNDDSPAGGIESRINNFTNQTAWVIGHAWSGSGTTTVNY